MTYEWLRQGILSYLKEHTHVDPPQLTSYFNVPVNITLTALNELGKEEKVERYWNGRYYEVRLLSKGRV